MLSAPCTKELASVPGLAWKCFLRLMTVAEGGGDITNARDLPASPSGRAIAQKEVSQQANQELNAGGLDIELDDPGQGGRP